MRKILTFVLLGIISISCKPKPKSSRLEYENLIILADMSSRLTNLPNKDSFVIDKIIDYFINECVQPGNKTDDKSSITFGAVSEKDLVEIDLEKYSYDIIQEFVNSEGAFKNNGLLEEIEIFRKKIASVYKNVRNPGLDLISVFMDKIENKINIKTERSDILRRDTTFFIFDNHVYLFTDGYLEYRNKRTNSQFYFGLPEIEQVRRYCRENDLDVYDALQENPQLGLTPYPGKYNHLIHLHILETHERDKDIRLQTYRNPLGLRDNEILEAVWRKWAVDSGFKSFEWRKY